MTTKTKIATPMPHIWLDQDGRAWIDDTNAMVIEVIFHKRHYGLKPDEIHDVYDGYLSLTQIHAALTYYYDHKAEIDAEMTA